jgi:hypothetical protein
MLFEGSPQFLILSSFRLATPCPPPAALGDNKKPVLLAPEARDSGARLADGVCHLCASATERLIRTSRGVACGLMLHFSIQFKREPHLRHKTNGGAEGAVGFVVVAEVARVPRE